MGGWLALAANYFHGESLSRLYHMTVLYFIAPLIRLGYVGVWVTLNLVSFS